MGYIYYCENILNHKGYVGQTTRTLKIRKAEHLKHLNSENVVFHAAIKKYGEENFVWSILGEYLDEDLDKYETYWIKQKNTHYQEGHGYNMNYGGAINSGSEKNSKRIKATNLITKEEKIYKSINEAARDLKANVAHISRICHGKKGNYSCKNYTFVFLDDNNEEIPTNFSGDTSMKKKGITIIAIDKNGNEYSYSSLRKAADSLKIDRHTIAKRIKDGKEFKGYLFK